VVTPYVREGDSDMFRRAVHLVVGAQLGAVTFIQRRLRIRFVEAKALLDEMTARGITGPEYGSFARKVLIKECQQCGRVGKTRYMVVPATEHDTFRQEVGMDPIWMCSSRTACRKRWPKTNEVDE